MTERTGFGYVTSLVAGALAFAAICSWRGLVAAPGHYLAPAAVAAVLVAATGATARRAHLHWYAVLGLQLVVLALWLNHRENPHGPGAGWWPTPHGVAEVAHHIRTGASDINANAAPVPAEYVHAPLYLLASSILVIVLVDLIACGFRQPAWAGLPVLVAVTIPISVLAGGLPASVYVATGLLFALLLAVTEAGRALTWGQAVDQQGTSADADRLRRAAALGARAVGVGAAATAAALAVSVAVPVGDGFFRTTDQAGSGGSGTGTVSLTNPMVDLRRDLVRNNHLALLDATTFAADPSYLRLTVLDQFSNGAWVPSTRDLSANNAADGALPDPPGLRSDQPGTVSTWRLITSRNFRTSWLPTPVPTRSIAISRGDWRYDPQLLDIASVYEPAPTSVSYQLTAFSPTFTADELERSPAPPAGLAGSMTKVPALPRVVTDLARQITAPGQSEYAKAVLLQNWFRISGGFTYSLAPAPGSGLEQLARFVTTDKVGYCEQFAATMALMARSVGIPARVVVGFLSPTKLISGTYRYTSDDLHAWPELYFAGAGWVRFEPTPNSRTGAAPSWARGDVGPGPTVAPPTSKPVTRTPKPPAKPLGSANGERSTGSSTVVAVLALVGAGIILVLLALYAPSLARARQRRRRLGSHPDPRVDLEGLWDELAATADDLGIERPADRSPRMDAVALAGSVSSGAPHPPGTADIGELQLLVRLVERARYQDRFVLDPLDRDRAVHAVQRWSELLIASVPSGRAHRARFLPTSIFSRRRGAGQAQ